MNYDNMNRRQKLDLPDAREAEDLARPKNNKPGYKAKSNMTKTVSVSTYKWSLRIITLLIALAFIAAVYYGLDWVFENFVTN